MNDNCALCGISATQSCSACKTIKYCGVEHQKKHWKIHKLDCRPFAIGNNENLGRYLYANRDIPAKTVIFTESPLVIGPKWYLNEREEYTPIVPCVGCYTPCRIGNYSCPKCRWPVCLPSCPGLLNTKLHAFECPILMLGPGPENRDDPKSLLDYYRTDALIVLKCLLLQWNTPKKWEELLQMQSHETEREGSDIYYEAEKRIVSYLEKNYLGKLKTLQNQASTTILQKYDTKMLRQLCGIIETNYMCINLLTGLELSGIFFTACMMEHSCLPNCYFTFDHTNGYKISIIAGCNIKKGEHLKLMYSNMLWGTQARQVHLNMTKHFTCQCERCLDPAELGTYFSALKCIGTSEKSPCNGIHLPENSIAEKIVWKCNECTANVNDDMISSIISEMGEEVNDVLAVKPTIQQLETLIEKLSSFLHTNHYHLFGLKHCLIQLYGTQTGYKYHELTNDLLAKKLQMCEQLLNICDQLDPFTIRLSIYVSVILLEMNSVLIEQNKRLNSAENLTSSEPVNKVKLQLAKKYLSRANEILQKELDNIGGSKLNDAVLKAIDNIENLLTS